MYYHLVLLDLADSEVVRLGVCEVEAGHAGGGQHGEAGGEADPGAGLHVQQPPHGHLATGDGHAMLLLYSLVTFSAWSGCTG